ncbi:guanine nucleotide-binding protein G(I)/G(S)/G(O) subunit gamma-10 isoform X1 [Myotis daubentonii]|uniref:guanine nucleotide-binding protein G(I)/G(S)/G(O) subunit gamma-10 isoform X1 n=1 Tax=Myotis daubentonii TaxID=98922 RepID=UPI002873E904|nr:guanine nucleotide-binding protein G(I)/G(S)/G(O) subunit gamma-10 isoform X1 [Myotis daubentonii]
MQRAGRWRSAVFLCVERGGAGGPGSSDPTVAIAYLAPPRRGRDRDPGAAAGRGCSGWARPGGGAGQRLPRPGAAPAPGPARPPLSPRRSPRRAARRHVLRGQRVRPAALGGAAQAGGRRGEDQGKKFAKEAFRHKVMNDCLQVSRKHFSLTK